MTSERSDAVIVGVGFGGIGAAIQLNRLGYENFVILDREDDLGGTWHVNRYPAWPSTFRPPRTRTGSSRTRTGRGCSTGDELKTYADDVADKYDVRRDMRFGTSVDGPAGTRTPRLWRVAAPAVRRWPPGS